MLDNRKTRLQNSPRIRVKSRFETKLLESSVKSRNRIHSQLETLSIRVIVAPTRNYATNGASSIKKDRSNRSED